MDIAHGTCYCRGRKRTWGTHIYLDKVSVGATINIMMAAVHGRRKNDVLKMRQKEPHVVDVANFLNSMGANIRGAGTDVIRIVGVEKLHKTEYSVIPDQIEAGTFMLAAAATHGDILVKNVIPKHLEATTAKLLEAGCRKVEEFDDAVRDHFRRNILSHTGYNTSVSGIPDRYAATDGSNSWELQREPVPLRRAFLKTVSNMWMN